MEKGFFKSTFFQIKNSRVFKRVIPDYWNERLSPKGFFYL